MPRPYTMGSVLFYLQWAALRPEDWGAVQWIRYVTSNRNDLLQGLPIPPNLDQLKAEILTEWHEYQALQPQAGPPSPSAMDTSSSSAPPGPDVDAASSKPKATATHESGDGGAPSGGAASSSGDTPSP